jgi:uncharacterized protein YacL
VVLSLLFALRVGAQTLQRWLPIAFLPPFEAFQGSSLPYWILLPVQLAILAVMLRVTWRVHARRLKRSARAARGLTFAGGLYVGVILARFVVGLMLPASPGWFHSQISIAFHFVLAMFVLTLAAYHRERPSRAL